MHDENIKVPTATRELEKQLLKSTWVKESELILKYVPNEDLNKTQLKLLNKCVEKEDFTDKQFDELKLLLHKYRDILQQLKPDETLENIDEAVKLIKTEQEFINMMDEDNQRFLVVYLPTNRGKLKFEFEVLPLKDSRVVEALDIQIDIFRDFDVEETTAYANATAKPEDELTEEEKGIIRRMNELVTEKVSKRKVEVVDNFLASQLRLKDSDADLDTRKLFWSKFHFNARFSVLLVVQKRLGLTEVDNRELFPFGE